MDYLGPTYAEARQWIVWLRNFTPSDLSDSMAVHPEVAMKFIKAAVWHGIIEDSGDQINGTGPAESIYSYVPLPPGPKEHLTWTPEWRSTEGCYSWAPRNRGMPVRIRKENQKASSTAGQGMKWKLRDRRFQEMEAARAAAKESQRNKRIKKESYLES